MINDAKNIAKDLGKIFNKLERSKNEALKHLTEEQAQKIAPITADLSRVFRAAKNGDVTELNQQISKYADIN